MANFNLTPPIFAKLLQDTWRELGGNPGLAPPAAWLEVGTAVLNKVICGLLDGDIRPAAWSQWRCSLMDLKALSLVVGLDPKTATLQSFLDLMHRDLFDLSAASDAANGLLADAIVAAGDPAPLSEHDSARIGDIVAGDGTNYSAHLLRLINKADEHQRRLLASIYPDHVAAFRKWQSTPLVELRASEPKPLLFAVSLQYDLGALLDYLRGLPWEDAKRILFGNAWGASSVRDPLLHEAAAIRVGERQLFALLPTDIEPHPGKENWVNMNCDFCHRFGLASMRQLNDKAKTNGFCVCPPCIARLVGASWQDDVLQLLWRGHAPEEAADQAADSDANQAGKAKPDQDS